MQEKINSLSERLIEFMVDFVFVNQWMVTEYQRVCGGF